MDGGVRAKSAHAVKVEKSGAACGPAWPHNDVVSRVLSRLSVCLKRRTRCTPQRSTEALLPAQRYFAGDSAVVTRWGGVCGEVEIARGATEQPGNTSFAGSMNLPQRAQASASGFRRVLCLHGKLNARSMCREE